MEMDEIVQPRAPSTTRSIAENDEAVNESRKRMEKRLEAVNFDKLAPLMNEALDHIEVIDKKKSVLVIGRTGAGKSTTVNYVKNSKMEIIDDEDLAEPQVRVRQGEREYVRIGRDESESETKYPVAIPIDEDDNSRDTLYMCDYPGFSDNRSEEEKICSSVSLPMVISTAQVHGLLIVIQYSDLLGKVDNEGFSKLMLTLADIFCSPENFFGSEAYEKQIGYVFTKVPEKKTMKTVFKVLEEKRKKLEKDLERNASELDEAFLKLYELYCKYDKTLEESFVKLKSKQGKDFRWEQFFDKIEQLQNKLSARDKEAVSDIEARQVRLSQEISKLNRQLLVCQSIERNRESCFIIRCDENDDKQSLMNQIKQFSSKKALPTQLFFDPKLSSRSETWLLMREVMMKIAARENSTTNVYSDAVKEKAAVKKHFLFLQQESQSLATIQGVIRQIQPGIFDSTTAREKLFQQSQSIEALNERLNKHCLSQIDQQLHAIRNLNDALAELDQDVAVPYLHPSIEPLSLNNIGLVKVQVNTYTTIFGGGVGNLYASIGLTVLNPVVGGVYLGVSFACFIAGAGLSLASFFVRDEEKRGRLASTAVKVAGGPTGYLINQFTNMLMVRSHTFNYQDIPYLRATPKADPPEYIQWQTSVKERVKTTFFARKMQGFREPKINKPEMGSYKIIYQVNTADGIDNKGEIMIWVQLEVEKRLLPDNKARIQSLRQQIATHESLQQNLFSAQMKRWQAQCEERASPFTGSINGRRYKEGLEKVVQQKLQLLAEFIRESKNHVKGLNSELDRMQREFHQKHAQHNMFLRLQRLLRNVPGFVTELMTEVVAQLQHQPVQFIVNQSTIWGRSTSTQQQPQYVAIKAKEKGSSLGCVFHPDDKTERQWFGKVETRNLNHVNATELSAFSQARQSSVFAAVM